MSRYPDHNCVEMSDIIIDALNSFKKGEITLKEFMAIRSASNAVVFTYKCQAQYHREQNNGIKVPFFYDIEPNKD